MYPLCSLSLSTLSSFFRYTKSKILKAPNNSSPWNYLRGLIPQLGTSAPYSALLEFSLALLPTSAEVSQNKSVDSNGRSPIGALEFCLDAAEKRIKNGEKENDGLRKEVREWIERLKVADPMRKRYWTYRLKEIEKMA